MSHCGMNAHHWRYMEWQLKPRTELHIQLHKSCCMTVKSTASCQFLFLTWHPTDSKWMPKGLRQFSTPSVQDVFKTDGRSAEYFLSIRWSRGKNCVPEGKVHSSSESLKLIKTRNAEWRGVRGQNPLTFHYWHCNPHSGCQPLLALTTTASSIGWLMKCFGWGIDGERFQWKGNVEWERERENYRTRREKYWSVLERTRYIFQVLWVSCVSNISNILWQP